ncbi:MAG TPA: P1 family peptidase [Bryobacteraceae bacterium]|nr:P1 family peptidase [Bryobacteraceae bacterium]
MERREAARQFLAMALLAGVSEGAPAPQDEAQSRDPNDWLGPGTITDVAGIKVGHFTLKARPTGCTAILCEEGAVAGVDVRGSAPGTRETDLLNPINTVQQVNAIMLSGGSAYGLDTATGAMRYLEEHGHGYKIGNLGVVPIVPAAILMDLGVGDFKIRPDAGSGYAACVAATDQPVQQGNVGAGAGATIGKMFGPRFAMKSGLGSASIKVGDTGIVVGAIVAVNAVGDVWNPKTAKIIAGARAENGKGFRNAMAEIIKGYRVAIPAGANTTIGVVATNVPLEKVQATKIAQMAHDGYARAINPVHTPSDGDTIFALGTGKHKVNADHGMIGALAAEAIAQAIVRAVTHAESLPGLPAYRDYVKRV